LKCGTCGGNLVITSGRSRRGHRRYGCSQHFYRGTCSNGLQVRKDWLEEKLLVELQSAVLQPDAIEYAVNEFCSQLRKVGAQLSNDVERTREEKRSIEAELNRLVAAVASAGHSDYLLRAIGERERQLQETSRRLQAAGDPSEDVQPDEIRSFVTSRLSRLPELLCSDVTKARAELMQHVAEIRLVPQHTETNIHYVAVGEWNLLGNYLEMDRARHLVGVRARLVAGVGFEPTTSGL
jgi:site-specific DNA recombinase